jgi:hypothetical protein
MPVWKPTPVTPAAVKAVAAPAAAAVAGSGQASTATQVITTTQTNTQTVTGDNNNIRSFRPPVDEAPAPFQTSQNNTNAANNYNVPVNIQVKDLAVAWNNSTATSGE